jgi:hypothetical protein
MWKSYENILHMKVHWPLDINLCENHMKVFYTWKFIDPHILIYVKIMWKYFAHEGALSFTY